MKDIPDAFDLQSYAVDVPEEYVAQYPAGVREESRLMVLDRDTGRCTLTTFRNIGAYLPPKSLLVANNTRVLPARLQGRKEDSGGAAEFLLLTPLPVIRSLSRENKGQAEVEGLLKSSRATRPGQRIVFGKSLVLTVSERLSYGRIRGGLTWQGDLEDRLEESGHVPLPPYIRRRDEGDDRDRYQTVYAHSKKSGSVAAPTAGLHFSQQLIRTLGEQGVGWAEISLYVGYGTFSPVRSRDVRQHRMHQEYFEVGEGSAAALQSARKAGRPIVAVGTTTVRTLETVMERYGSFQACAGWTGLFIYPGFAFKAVDHLVTNFHLPESSLILMVSAFAGKENILRAYETAVAEKMRFYSYGDAMLIL